MVEKKNSVFNEDVLFSLFKSETTASRSPAVGRAIGSGSRGAEDLPPPHFCDIINNFFKYILPWSTLQDLKTLFLIQNFN